MREDFSAVILSLLIVAAMTLVMLSGCPPKAPSQTAPTLPAMPGGTGTEIKQFGSTTILPIAQKWQEAFNRLHPEIKIAVSGGGSGTGIAQLAAKTCNIANASRRIKDEEIQAARGRGVSPYEIPIAYDAIAVIVNPANPLQEISVEKLSDIYTGAVTQWDRLGVPGLGSIQVITRDSASGTYESFKSMVVTLNDQDKSRNYTPAAVQQASSEGVVQTVAQTKAAIGYVGLGYLTGDVKALKIIPLGGDRAVLPCEASVRDNSYPISRQLYMYTDGEPTGTLKTYIDWCLGPEGQALVRDAGYIPLEAPAQGKSAEVPVGRAGS
jgi:phosphate transport system substrate-binding protein